MRSRVRLVLLPISVEGGSAGGLARGQSERAVAAHFNETDTAAHLIPIQDAGLQTYLRSLDIKFTQGRDLVAG
jgi:hypothetical protein